MKTLPAAARQQSNRTNIDSGSNDSGYESETLIPPSRLGKRDFDQISEQQQTVNQPTINSTQAMDINQALYSSGSETEGEEPTITEKGKGKSSMDNSYDDRDRSRDWGR